MNFFIFRKNFISKSRIFCRLLNRKKALHVAIVYEHKEIIEMLINHKEINLRLQNYDGLTPFACSLRVKNTKAAEHILEKEPTTAEQFDK